MRYTLMYLLYMVMFVGIDVLGVDVFGISTKRLTPTELLIMAFVMLYINNENRKEKR